MSFKIVQTVGKKGKENFYVPAAWEMNSMVAWPPSNFPATRFKPLQNDPNSVPPDEWAYYKCVVKQVGIQTVGEAKKLVNSMMEGTSTSTSDDEDLTRLRKRAMPMPSVMKTFSNYKYVDSTQRIVSTFNIFDIYICVNVLKFH